MDTDSVSQEECIVCQDGELDRIQQRDVMLRSQDKLLWLFFSSQTSSPVFPLYASEVEFKSSLDEIQALTLSSSKKM